MMRRNVRGSICGFCIIIVAAVATESGQTRQGNSHMQPEDWKVLKRWLDITNSQLRPATVADCDDAGGLSTARATWGNDYHPYYRLGDFNRDGHDDFAIALIDPTKKKNRFSIAIFHGGKASPTFIQPARDLGKYGMHNAGGLLIAALSDEDDCVIHLWDGRRYIMKNCVV